MSRGSHAEALPAHDRGVSGRVQRRHGPPRSFVFIATVARSSVCRRRDARASDESMDGAREAPRRRPRRRCAAVPDPRRAHHGRRRGALHRLVARDSLARLGGEHPARRVDLGQCDDLRRRRRDGTYDPGLRVDRGRVRRDGERRGQRRDGRVARRPRHEGRGAHDRPRAGALPRGLRDVALDPPSQGLPVGDRRGGRLHAALDGLRLAGPDALR